MQTIDIQEMITLEPALAETDWAEENGEKNDVELSEVIEALLSGKLPAPQTMGYLIDREVFTSKQQMLMVSLLDNAVPRSTGKRLHQTVELHKLEEPGMHGWLEVLDEERKELRDSRPREAGKTIQMYLRSYIVTRIYAESLDKIAPSTLSRNLFETSATQLKTAFFHFFRGGPLGVLPSFYADLKRVVLANPPAESDEYSV